VAFHGTINDLRALAPDPGHLLSTGDDVRAQRLALERHTEVVVAADPGGGLIVSGSREQLSSYVADLVRADVELLEFTPTQTPLEALFFMLTDTEADAQESRRTRGSLHQEAGVTR